MLPLGVSSSKNDNWFTAIQTDSLMLDSSAWPVLSLCSNDGSYSYVYGQSVKSGTTFSVFVQKFDRFGNMVWQKSIACLKGKYIGDMCTDNLNNLYLNRGANIGGATYPFISKLSSSGNLEWTKGGYYQSSVEEESTSICLSSDQSYICVGRYYSSYVYYLKMNTSDGTTLLAKRLQASSSITNSQMCLDSNDNRYVSMSTSSGANIVKLNSSESIVWQRYISGINISDISVDSSGNVFLSGYTYNPQVGNTTRANTATAVVIKYNSSGTIQWQKSISSTGTPTTSLSAFLSLKVSSDQKIYCSLLLSTNFAYFPSLIPSGYGSSYPYVLCLDSNGSLLWSKEYGALMGNQFDQSFNAWPNKMSIDKNNTLYLSYGYPDYIEYMEYSGIIKFTPNEMLNNLSFSISKDINTYQQNVVISKDQSLTHTVSISNSNNAESAGLVTNADTTFYPTFLSNDGFSSYTFSQIYKYRI
jgi:hypothetical protein